MSTKKIVFISCAVAVAALALWIILAPASDLTGQAPDFHLSDPAGRIVSLSQFRGHPVLVNFWATWCPACREEIPDLETVYRQEKKTGFTILGVSVDEDGKNAVLPFLASSPITYPVLLCDPQTANAYKIYELPTSFLIGPDGTIAQKYIGPIDPTGLENDILNVMHEVPRRKK